MVTESMSQSVNQSMTEAKIDINNPVDIDSYFDIDSPTDVHVPIDIDSYFDTLDSDTGSLDLPTDFIKTSGDENQFQLPKPVYEPIHSGIKQPLDQHALEQSAYEIRLLARQLDNSPFTATPAQDLHVASSQKRSSYGVAIRRLPLIVVGLLLSGLPMYMHYSSKCLTVESCIQYAKHQLISLSSDRYPPIRVSPTSVSKTVIAANAIAPTTQESESTISNTDPFREAVNHAMQAAELTQIATRADDWETVANQWLEAIRLMNMTPSNSPRYSIATVKVEEYAKNLAYAQRRMREAISSTEPQEAVSSHNVD